MKEGGTKFFHALVYYGQKRESVLTLKPLIFVTKNKRKNSPFQSSFFLFTQCNPHAVPKQDLCPTHYGYPASMDSYTHNYDKKKLSVYQAF